MPSRHGIAWEDTRPYCRFGIWAIFMSLTQEPFRITPLGILNEPVRLEFHFRRSLQVLLHALDLFQQKYMAFDKFLVDGGLAGPNPGVYFDVQIEINLAAQSIFTNLNVVLDDIARIIPFVAMRTPSESQKPQQGFGQFKNHRLPKDPTLSKIHGLAELFDSLESGPTWWKTGFDFGGGIRQRLSHQTDLILLEASAPQGESRLRPQVQLIRVGTADRTVDFPHELRELLHDLCEWLDKLEKVLTECLSCRAQAEKLKWEQNKECPGYSLPIVVGRGESRDFPPEDCHYLPICKLPSG